MTGVNAPSGANRPGRSPLRRLYYWGPVAVLVLILVASFVANSALKTSNFQGIPPAVPANVGNATPGVATVPETAVPTPVQADSTGELWSR